MVHPKISWLGKINVVDALDEMALRRERVAEGAPGEIILAEHFAVYTVGRAGVNRKYTLGRKERVPHIHKRVHPVLELDRGGDVTYHGPGMLMVYPILPIKRMGVTLIGYLRSLETAGIAALGHLGVEGYTRKGLTGIWTKDENGEHAKIAAIGVGCKRWVSYHGMSVNVTCDMKDFDAITPCGLVGERVTRLADIISEPPSLEELGESIAEELIKGLH